MIKVLQVFGEPISRGGQETFVMNAYRNIDRSKIQVEELEEYDEIIRRRREMLPNARTT